MRAVESTPLHSHGSKPFRKSSYDSSGTGLISDRNACDLRDLAFQMKQRPITKQPPSPRSDNPDPDRFSSATRWSLGINFLLLIVKVYVSYVSSSLAFLASAVDSLLDLVSQSIIFYALRGNENVDEAKYPLGRARLEPVGIVVVAALMGMASLQVVLESLYRIIDSLQDSGHILLPEVSLQSIIILLISIGLKFGLYVLCRQFANESDSMLALSQDHLNDVLSNGVALVAAFLASRDATLWFLDPLGAICISCFIVYNWVETAREQTDKLVGRTAELEFITTIETIAKSHDKRVLVDINVVMFMSIMISVPSGNTRLPLMNFPLMVRHYKIN
ncbi:hypothetical protein BASA81_010754 [Batrachochytrium salamandrivorans]|nr:hypothetical protein BASA81_010754 [Batrachochytrium salamandrivorans]